MRDHFAADWAFAIRGSLEKVVGENFPQDLYNWPMLKTFNFESYMWQEIHAIFVLLDKLTGISAGSNKPYVLNDSYAPREVPVADKFNPKVVLEYGFMHALNKPTLLLADVGLRSLRVDMVGTLREQFGITDIKGSIKKPVEKWLKELCLDD